uniref:Uncharacterized protein n=1 Tax=Arundo donax TaxID=35708 RepID=A0A0A8YD51_ARUDO
MKRLDSMMRWSNQRKVTRVLFQCSLLYLQNQVP